MFCSVLLSYVTVITLQYILCCTLDITVTAVNFLYCKNIILGPIYTSWFAQNAMLNERRPQTVYLLFNYSI